MSIPLSTATPERIPDIEVLRRLTKSIAILDAIICPEWEYRYYSYNSKWGPGEEMASMRNGCGDEWFLLFDPHGAALKGFAHESPLAQEVSFAARIQETVPAVFESFLKEPAFSMDMATFCIWRCHADVSWSVVAPASGGISSEEDGSAELITILDADPTTYQTWAVDYYEREIPLAVVQAIYGHRALSGQLIASLNSERVHSDVIADAREIGYPIETSA
jgi:hypothetical protein